MTTKTKSKPKPKTKPKQRAKKPLPATVVKRGAKSKPPKKRASRGRSKKVDVETARQRIRDFLLWELQGYHDRASLKASDLRRGAERFLEEIEKRDGVRREAMAAIGAAISKLEEFALPLLRVAPLKHLKIATDAAGEQLADARKLLNGIEETFSRWRDSSRTELSCGRRVLVSLGWPVAGPLPAHPMLQALAIQLSRLGMDEKAALAELLSFPAWANDFPHDLLDGIADLATAWRDCWAAAGEVPEATEIPKR